VEDEKKEGEAAKPEDDGLKKANLYRALWATFKTEILITAAWKLANDILVFINPQLLKALLGFLSSEINDPLSDVPEDDKIYYEPRWAGYIYAVGIFLVAVLTSFVLQR
jgi:ATP-binding cassette subfamily C (CFTR/MRP) protein 2